MKLSIKERIIYWLAKIMSKLSINKAHRLGALFGKILYILPNSIKTTSSINLNACFPNKSKEEHKEILKNTLIETGKSFFESPVLWFADISRIRYRIINIEGEDILEQSFKEGRGAIIIIPHLGAWEMLSLAISHKYPTTTLYKPLRLKGLEQKIVQARSRLGNNLVPTTTTGVKAVFSAIRKGEIVAILADQNPGIDNGIFSPFFGIPALTTTLPSKLAQKTHAPVFTLVAKRCENGFKIIWHKCEESTENSIYNPDLQKSVNALNKMMEDCIEPNLTQYQWSYKRFKNTPNNEKSIYT